MPTRTILFLAANPIGTNQLRLDAEAKKIREALQRSVRREEFRFEQRGATTAEDLRRALTDLKPEVVHFSGHGCSTGELILERDAGTPHYVSPEGLAGLFELSRDHVQCVLLNACYSNDQAAAIAQHVPFVIGTTAPVGDEASIIFSGAFYDSLGAGESYQQAYRRALAALKIDGSGSLHQSDFHILKQARILGPRNGETVGPEWVPVSGMVGEGLVGQLYLFTGAVPRFYPSSKLTPDNDGNWEGRVHVGTHRDSATISLVVADQLLADYIDFYRDLAETLRHQGMTLSRLPGVLHSVRVTVDLSKSRS
jgi:hypothetical protein